MQLGKVELIRNSLELSDEELDLLYHMCTTVLHPQGVTADKTLAFAKKLKNLLDEED